jgi:lipopolysaccharide export system permease protein
LGLTELSNFARGKTGKEKTEAEILWQRRIILSITPLIFAVLGVSLVIRFNRGGQGFGIVLALMSLLIHYLLTLLGEQLARTNQITVRSAGLIPIAASIAVIGWFFLSKRILTKNVFDFKSLKRSFDNVPKLPKVYKSGFYPNLKTRILDFDITVNLLKYFLLTFSFLTSVYLIFTAFELWKFAGEINDGFFILIEYLFYLLPFIYIQLAPSALMIAVLATFVVKSRQNEIVTWTSAGQSVYRLLFPCFVLMMFIGLFNWQFQEKIVPAANQKQDDLRALIRSRGKLTVKTGKYWIAEDERIFSFELGGISGKSSQRVKNLSIYEFSEDQTKLRTIYKTPAAVWEKDKIRFSETAEKTVWTDGKVNIASVPNLEIRQKVNPFANFFQKPNHLTAEEIKNLAETSESDAARRNYQVALQKRYTIPFLPFVITLFTAPFALSLSRKGKVITIGYAVGIWLVFIGLTNIFEQFGANDFISPGFAVWSPILLFSILGAYLLSKVKT